MYYIINQTEAIIHNMCDIINDLDPRKVKEKKRQAKCRFIPAGDTKAKCAELCSDKPNCKLVESGDCLRLATIRPIIRGEELTTIYTLYTISPDSSAG